MTITYGSVCSGIEAATVAWHPLGWKPAWFSEIEPFPSAVLAHHYPDVANLGDMTTIAERVASGEVEAPAVLVGGTPCQSFSVAGMREGLADERGQLTISFVELADEIDRTRIAAGNEPCTIVWENVPGVLSSKDNAFGCFLAALAGENVELESPGRRWANAGYVRGPQRTVAWRILDAQYFGVAQRRRRVFVVASARKGFCPATVLFEFEGVRRDSAPSREAGQGFTHDVAPCLTSSDRGVERTGDSRGQDPVISMAHGQGGAEVRTDGGAPTLTCNHEAPIAAYAVRTANTGANGHGISPELCHTLDGANGQAVAFNARQDPVSGDVAGALDTSSPQAQAVAFQPGNLSRGAGAAPSANVFPTLKADHGRSFSDQSPHVCHNMAVRRLTPRECERLQAFPDDYTLVPYRNKPAADGPRYKALGNSMCVNVMRWIGRRVDNAMRTATPANDNRPISNKLTA